MPRLWGTVTVMPGPCRDASKEAVCHQEFRSSNHRVMEDIQPILYRGFYTATLVMS